VLLVLALLLQSSIKLEISAPKTVFFLGETIPLRLSFTSTQPNTFVVSGDAVASISRITQIDQFIVDRVADAEDPMQGLPGQSGGIGTLHSAPAVLSETPFVSEKILNEWVRFREPGTFQVHVLSRRVRRVGEHGPPMEVVSNVLTLEIRPAPEAWVKAQIDSAVKVLDAPLTPRANAAREDVAKVPLHHPPPLDDDATRERFLAGRTLRFLDSPEAAIQLLLHLNAGKDLDSYSLHLGVLGSPYRAQLLPLMEERLVAPGQPIWEKYLDTLVRLRQLVTGEEGRDEYLTRLGESMASKEAQPRAISLSTLLAVPPGTDRHEYVKPEAVTALVADFPRLPPDMQRAFLEDWARWRVIEGPAMIPILRRIYDAASAPELADIALIRLFWLAKVETRELILAQIRNPTKHLSNSALTLLADQNLPELNDTLAASLEGPTPNEWLILRYATGDIVKRVEKYYLQHENDSRCASPLVFYFLKYDPAFGERELRRNLSTTGGQPTCYDMELQFRDLGRYAMSDTLERLMIEYLSSPIARIERGAAWVLGKYGSAAAQKPLWDALADFRTHWKGREEQLTKPPAWEARGLERALELALLESQAWEIEEKDLQHLETLCSSDTCKVEIVRWRARSLGIRGPQI